MIDRSPVKIPKSLINKLTLFGPRFIKVQRPIPGEPKSGKGAVEHGWQKQPYEANEIKNWVEAGNNYGVICGKGLYEIDLDDLEMQQQFEAKVQTFTVKSGSGVGRHYYTMSGITENATILSLPDKDGKRENLGNIQAKNKYVVGPGCNHYTGGKYEIIKDVPFAWVSKADLEAIFGEHLVWAGHRQKIAEEQAKNEQDLIGIQIPMDEIVDFSELKQISVEEWQGPHPIHGSTTGVNFCVNKAKNCWHCFRCNSGGGALSWLAVKHGLIRCDQAQKGALKGSLFLKVLDIARKEGYDVKLPGEEEITPDVSKYFEGTPPHFVPAYLANELLKKFHYITRETDETIFLYHPQTGTYTPNGEAHIKNQVKKALGKYFRKHRLSEVLCYINASTITKIKDTPPHLTALKNGILNLKTGKIEGFTPDYFILNALPVKYDEKADCPIIKKFIKEIVHEEDIPVLQEIAGYCLLRDYFIHKAFMFIGEGANGKSTFMELLRAILGNENVSTIPLQTFDTNRFAVSSIYGKLANIYPDLSDKALKRTGLFKMLTGGDTISAEYKFKDFFYFKNYAKLIFSANKVPETSDDTTAFFRRWIIINFPNQFTEDNPKTDKNIIKKLTTEEELSGFLNWALKGLRRLPKNNKFNNSKSVEETRARYIRVSNPIQAFVMDCIEFQSGSFVPKREVYKAFIEYCQKMKLPSRSMGTFSRKLIEYIPKAGTTRRKINGKRVLCWQDIKVVSEVRGSYNSTEQSEIIKKEHKHTVKKPIAHTDLSDHDKITLEDFGDVAKG